MVWSSVAMAWACGGQGTAERDPNGGAVVIGDGYTPPPVAMPWQPPAGIEAGSPVAAYGQLRIEGQNLVAADGSPVQLKGVSTMWLNWENRYGESKGALQWMRDNWGLSVIRAAMGIEPNNAYLANPAQAEAQVRRIVQNAIDLGVYVIIDWHDHNAHLHQTQAIDFFTKMATDYGAFPNVLYETYNEPTPRDTAGAMVSWDAQIKPYHEAVLGAIRAIDPDNVVVLGNPQWDQRPDLAAASPVAGTNLMYSVHFYSCSHRDGIRQNAQRAYDAGLALFVTEWGATNADGGVDGTVCVDEAQRWHDWMNQYGISWAAWKLDGCSDSSCFFANDSAPADGNWPMEMLSGHAPFVVARMLE